MITEFLVFLNQPHLMVPSRHFWNGQKKSLRISQSQTITSSFLSSQLQQPQKTSFVREHREYRQGHSSKGQKGAGKVKAQADNKPQDVQDLTKEIKDIQEEIDKLNSKLEQKKSALLKAIFSQVYPASCDFRLPKCHGQENHANF